MWKSERELLARGAVCRYALERTDRPASHAEVIAGWRRDPEFRAWFVSLLADAPYPAYFWETPPVTSTSRQRTFEFVLVESPELGAVTADSRPFDGHFRAADPGHSVVSFPNLGGDAYLVAPCPLAADSAYPHLGAFSREAPADQQQDLWRAVGVALEQRMSTRPLWVSTAGLGVFWLHVRLDTRPKYYSFAPYRQALLE